VRERERERERKTQTKRKRKRKTQKNKKNMYCKNVYALSQKNNKKYLYIYIHTSNVYVHECPLSKNKRT